MPTLYERIPHGKTYRYREYVTPDPTVPKPQMEYSDEEIITLGVSVGAILLTQLEQPAMPNTSETIGKSKRSQMPYLNLQRGRASPLTGNRWTTGQWCGT